MKGFSEGQMCEKASTLNGFGRRSTWLKSPNALLLCCIIALLSSNTAHAVSALTNLYRIDSVSSNGNLTVAKYIFASNMPIAELRDVSVWQHLITNRIVYLNVYAQQPDWKTEMLSNGFIRLNNPDEEIRRHIDAEKFASNRILGLWSDTAGAENTYSGVTNIGSPILTLFQNDSRKDTKSVSQILFLLLLNFWHNTVYKIITMILGSGLGLAFLVEIFHFIQGLKNRHDVRLVILGPEGTGKTSMYVRLDSPDLTKDDLKHKVEEIKRAKSKGPGIATLPQIGFGDMRIQATCIYPGPNEELWVEEHARGSFLTRLLQLNHFRKVFIPETIIWLVVLAHTKGDKNTSGVQAILENQFGYLSLVKAMINQKKKARGLRLVLLCMNKAELLLHDDPYDGNGASQLPRIQERYKYHTKVLAAACLEHGIKFSSIACSSHDSNAHKMWGFRGIHGHIKDIVRIKS